ncbi:trypsin-like peptidase domain-containing protein [Actinophytocola sp.]|uniref:trypsin-like peptidase domain-containing protein n=1 Tax=Actinophytocola sp. TaxID=1872138 RepID=UPI002ED312FA
MIRRLLGVTAALGLALAAPAGAATENTDLAGTALLGGCSGSLVRTPNSAAGDPALVLTNGHCYEGASVIPDEVLVDQPSNRLVTLLDGTGQSVASLRATRALYVTMTGTDIALYRLTESYTQLERRYHVRALPLSAERPRRGMAVEIVSSGWQQVLPCEIDGFAYRVLEATYVTKDVIRYTPDCAPGPGVSGSPVVSGGKVVGVHNTSNRDGGSCTRDNPCEMDRLGNISARKGAAYATQTYWITTCVRPGNNLDLTLPGCLLPD